MAQGGPSGAMEMFLRWADGDAGYESLDPEFRERMLGDGEVLFGIEMRSALSTMPTSDQLASIEVPCAVVAGSENRDPAATHHWAYEAAQWAAEALDAPSSRCPAPTGR